MIMPVIIDINDYNIFVISQHCDYQEVYVVKVDGGTGGK